MKTIAGVLGLVAVVAVLDMSAFAEMSTSTRLVRNPENSLIWHTCHPGVDEIAVVWPSGAKSARLTLVGKDGPVVRVLTPPTSSCSLTAPATAADEDVVDLSLEFFASTDASGEALADETLTATGIGLVRGVDGGELDLRTSDVTSRQWNRIKNPSAVLPVLEGTTSLTIAGTSRELSSIPGWCLWSPILANPAVPLELTTADETYDRLVRCGNFGLSVLLK